MWKVDTVHYTCSSNYLPCMQWYALDAGHCDRKRRRGPFDLEQVHFTMILSIVGPYFLRMDFLFYQTKLFKLTLLFCKIKSQKILVRYLTFCKIYISVKTS